MAKQSPYIIILKNETGATDSPVAGNSGNSESKYTVGQKRAQSVVKALVAYDKYAAPFIESAIRYQVSTIELRTGATELQQRTEFVLGVAKQAGNLATSILTGYAIGNLPGAIIGGLISVGTTAINYANRQRTIQTQASLEGITLRGMNVRAGGYAPSYGASRSGTQ